MNRTTRQAFVLLVGILFAQAAWVMAVAPFRGIDEFDHAFRAAGVASGDWLLKEAPEDGRGLLVTVPVELAASARAQCEQLAYTLPDNCRPVETKPDGSVVIATGAATYHPAYYFVVGLPASIFDGTTSLYAMRATSALLCAVGIAWASACVIRPGRSKTALGFLVATSPMLLFSTSIVAPNGLEMVAGLLLWCSLLRLVDETEEPWRALPVVAAVSAGCALAVLRPLGPLWISLIVVVVALFTGRAALTRTWRRRSRGWLLIGGAWALSVVTSISWTLLAGFARQSGGGDEPPDDVTFEPVIASVQWVLQLIGAFPYRDQPAPLPVYTLGLLVALTLVWLGLRWAERTGERLAVILAAMFTVAVPMLFTYATMAQLDVIWQGRYSLPFAVGIPLLCGTVLDRSSWAPREGDRLVLLGGALLAVAHVMSVVRVLTQELDNPVSAADPNWVEAGPLGIGLTMTTAWVLMLWWLVRTQSIPKENADSRSWRE